MRKSLRLLMVFSLLTGCSRPHLAEERSEGKPEREDNTTRAGVQRVDMTIEAQRRSGVAVEAVSVRDISDPLEAAGTVHAIDSRLAHVRSLARGRLLDVVAKVGDRVTENQTLARFDNIEAGELVTERQEAETDLSRLKLQLAAQTRVVERNRRLSEIGAAPQKDFEASMAERQAVEKAVRARESALAGILVRLRRLGVSAEAESSSITAVRSPFAGVVLDVAATPGAVIDSATELFRIADLSSVYVEAHIYEKDLGLVRRGGPVTFSVETYPGMRFSGHVAAIGDVLDAETRTAPVRCLVPNGDGRLKLGMLAKVELASVRARKAIAVPLGAVQTIEGKPVLFVRQTETQFLARFVETARTGEEITEISHGLKPGEMVAVRGAFALKSVLQAGELEKDK